MNISRRGFLSGLLTVVSAPAIVCVENLMVLPAPQRIILPEGLVAFEPNLILPQNSLLSIRAITMEAVRLFKNTNAFVQHINAEYAREYEFASGEQWTETQLRSLRDPEKMYCHNPRAEVEFQRAGPTNSFA